METMGTEGSLEQPFYLSAEHCYSKQCVEPMDSDQSPPGTIPTSVPLEDCSGLTKLSEGHDTFETVLLLLLQTFTSHQRKTSQKDMSGESSKFDISTEALNCLSAEQVMALVTSNSVNYEVIQEIISKKRKHEDSKVNAEGMDGDKGNSAKRMCSDKEASDEQAQTSLSLPVPDFNQQLLQVTPEQLQQIQTHITELIHQQKVTLSPDLSTEQQFELIQTLLIQQLNIQNSASEPVDAAEPTPTNTGGPSGTKTTPTLPSQPSTTAVGTPQNRPKSQPPSSKVGSALSGLTFSTQKRKKEAAIKEPKKPPKPYNIFFSEVYSTVMAGNPKMSLPESSKIISTMWNAMGDDVKKRYNEECERLQQEYLITMQQFQASQQEPTEPQSTLQLLLTKSSLVKPQGVVTSSVRVDTKPVVSVPGLPNATTPSVSTTSPRTEPTLLVANESSSQASVSALTITNMDMTPPVSSVTSGDSKNCVNTGCNNLAVYAEDRGTLYCSSDCVVKHCRSAFDTWVNNRKVQV